MDERLTFGLPTTRKAARPVNTSAFSGTDSYTRAEILSDRLACQRGARLRAMAEAALAL